MRKVLSLSFLIALFVVSCSTQSWQLKPFYKSDRNPILTPRGDSWESKDVFNPATWSDGSMIYMFYRAEDSTGIGKWNGTSRIGLATSTNGINFKREEEPILEPTEEWELPGGCEDPRIAKIDSTFYLTYTAYDGEAARLALATSTDLHNWTKHGLVFPDSSWTKSGAIIPKKINGKYWMYFGDTNIWAAHSKDLLNWTAIKEPVLTPRKGKFDGRLVEPGPTPIISNRGILLLYNGANEDLIYESGQALFDPKDPTKLIARSDISFLQPNTQLERTGQVPNVVFIEGLSRLNNSWYLYYGMGDSGIGVAVKNAF